MNPAVLSLVETSLYVLGGLGLVGLSTAYFQKGSLRFPVAFLLALGGLLMIVWRVLLEAGVRRHQPLWVEIPELAFVLALAGGVFAWTSGLFAHQSRQLSQTSDRLRSSLATQELMLDVLSHDVRNHLTAARGHLELHEHEEGQADHVTSAGTALEKADELIDTTLLYSRLDGEDREAEAVDLVATARQVVEGLAAHREHHGVDIDVEAPETLSVRTTPLVARALENLVDNAIKFSPSGGTVTVRIRDGDPVRVAVVDHGPGLPAERREELFDRFSPARAEASGTGLGLAITRRIVAEADGQLGYEETPGGGATFTIALPASPTAGDAPGDPGAA
jgi:signal transduction histidine kinase